MTNTGRRAIATALAEEGWVVTQAEVDSVLKELAEMEPRDEEDAESLLASLVDDAVNSVHSRSSAHYVPELYRAGLEDAIELAREERLGFANGDEYWFDTAEVL